MSELVTTVSVEFNWQCTLKTRVSSSSSLSLQIYKLSLNCQVKCSAFEMHFFLHNACIQVLSSQGIIKN